VKMTAKLGYLDEGKTAFFLCDVQEKFRDAISHFKVLLKNSQRLVEVSSLMNVPLLVTEQYPKGLGSTVEELNITRAVKVVPKTSFTMLCKEAQEALSEISGRCSGDLQSVVLFGIEAHVCVEQTAMDLIKQGYVVHVVADATSSRSMEDRMLAFERLRQIGCFIATTENIIFKLLKDKQHPSFNNVRTLVKEVTEESGLVVPTSKI